MNVTTWMRSTFIGFTALVILITSVCDSEAGCRQRRAKRHCGSSCNTCYSGCQSNGGCATGGCQTHADEATPQGNGDGPPAPPAA
jgi:hypothetical protein